MIVTQDEVIEKEKVKSDKKNLAFCSRECARLWFATSRRFIWDMMSVNVGGKNVIALHSIPKKGILCGRIILQRW